MSRALQGLVLACAVGVLAAGAWAEDKDRTTKDKTTKDKAAKDRDKENQGTLDEGSFVQKAASANLHEIKMGEIGSKRATATEVKEFAQRMVKDHTEALEKLKKAARAAKIDVPSKQSKEHEDATAHLDKHEGKNFDAAFMRHMVSGHEKALKLHERGAKDVKNADVRKYAEDAVPVIREHLKLARKINATVGGKDKDKGRKDKGGKDRTEKDRTEKDR